jgi:hypothetical protein
MTTSPPARRERAGVSAEDVQRMGGPRDAAFSGDTGRTVSRDEGRWVKDVDCFWKDLQWALIGGYA